MNTTPSRYPVTCELQGRIFRGKYWIAGKIMTVATGWGGKSRQVGAMPPATLAQHLLGELAKEGKA